ncbi:hypothetical protein GJ496_001088 [Pomphorhynchus laevis]|nr:hypothetical protein GJ496_001088 [Pomphorhynchus laevis]
MFLKIVIKPAWIRTDEAGSPRRCAGQGDLLAGAAACFAGWTSQSNQIKMMSSAMTASRLIRRAAQITFSQRRRSMITSDIIDNIGIAFEQLSEYTPSSN